MSIKDESLKALQDNMTMLNCIVSEPGKLLSVIRLSAAYHKALVYNNEKLFEAFRGATNRAEISGDLKGSICSIEHN